MISTDRIARCLVGALGLVSTFHGIAVAQPTAEESRWAECLVAEGRVLKARNDLDGALRRFQAADKLVHQPATTFAVAEVQSILGSLVEARRTLRTVLAAPSEDSETAASSEARGRALRLDDELKGRMVHLRFEVSGVPAGKKAQVFVDGAITPVVGGQAVDVNPGRHAIVGQVEGRQVTKNIEAREHDDVSVPLAFGAYLGRDGAQAGNFESLSEARTRGGLPKVAYVGLGVGAAGVVVGGVTGFLALMAKKSAERGCAASRCPPPAAWDGDQTQRALSKASTASLMVGAAGVGLAIGSLLVQKKSTSAAGSPAANVGSSIRVNPAMGGLSVSGKW